MHPKTIATSATNSVNIYSVLTKKRQKRGAELAKAEMEKAKTEKARLEMEAERAKAIIRPASSSAVIDIADNGQNTDFCDPEGGKETPIRPPLVTSARQNHITSMSQRMSQSAAMDSDSQRPTLSRFRRFADRYSKFRKSNGYLSARVRLSTATAVRLHILVRMLSHYALQPEEITTNLNDVYPVAPPVVCEAVSLVVHRAAVAGLVDELSNENNGQPVNFKKFKKVLKYFSQLKSLCTYVDNTKFTIII